MAQKRPKAKPSSQGAVPSFAMLRARIARAKLAGVPAPVQKRARAALDLYLNTAEARGLPVKEVLRDMASGRAALRVGAAEIQAQVAAPDNPLGQAACRAGCAFCCILSGKDGGVITEEEARQLHARLSTVAGDPDGRDWHAHACPALDPTTLTCRAYDVRPMICRSYFSVDVTACRIVSEGGSAPGTGVLGGQVSYLAVHALVRVALKGLMHVPTFSIAATAAAAVSGREVEDALATAEGRPAALLSELKRAATGP